MTARSTFWQASARSRSRGLQVRVQFDQSDQHAARALGMDKGMSTARIAESMADELAARFDHLRASVVETVDVETNMMQAGPARLQELAQVRLRPQRANDLETNPAVAFEIIRR